MFIGGFYSLVQSILSYWLETFGSRVERCVSLLLETCVYWFRNGFVVPRREMV
jgi:hypothetical protein